MAQRRGGRAAGVAAGTLDEDLAQDKKEHRKEEIEKESKIGDGQMEGRIGGEKRIMMMRLQLSRIELLAVKEVKLIGLGGG